MLVVQHGAVLQITLNRPARLNAFNPAMHSALHNSLQSAADSTAIRAVLLTGAGRAFCAGQDLSERDPRQNSPGSNATLTHDLGKTLETYYNPLVRRLRSLEKPVVCAVNGVAAGAGASVALACDIVLAARSARFIQAFSRIGLVPDTGGSWLLPRLVGEARAKGLIMTAEPISAEQAADWGLIWRVFDDDQLASEAAALAQRLADGPTRGLALSKAAIQSASENSLDQQLDLERDLQRKAGQTLDYAEGVAAFLDKRSPIFTGQ
ncbi:MAG: 2-(1,2-epoxy-1,2-dihydrophenyl)acetyl-CoA isomerase PaaG [Lautropia sp.]|nr:2-(1,2-epoxy-1,2-dihydrophenyl)acetyl-CoA isomerase PaaG [Lautropia sp.]